MGLRHSEYSSSAVDLGLLTVERYWKRYRCAYTSYPVFAPGGGSAQSHALGASFYYGEGSGIGIGYAVGKEIESTGPVGLVVSKVHGFYVRGSHGMCPGWALTYVVGSHRQGSHYTRNWCIRVRATAAIGRMGTPEDEPRLIELLSDNEWWVRYRAAQALAQLPFVSRARLEEIRREHPDRFARDILAQVIAEQRYRAC